MTNANTQSATAPVGTVRDFTHDCCFNCGHDRFTWSRTVSLRVTVEKTTAWREATHQPAEMPVWLRRCDGCGNLQLFDPDMLQGQTQSP